ncbi:MAG: hypothetical protein HQL01_07025 [Nitrospirae bacterium]|nr:hypothetical protein [Nitrospirota bacterium]
MKWWLALYLLLLLPACSKPVPETKQPGSIPLVAFDYNKLKKPDIEFLSQFDIVVTGKFADSATVKRLKSRGAKLIFYDWLPALYYCSSGNGEWAQRVYDNKEFWTLDPSDSDPNPMGSRYGCADYFYDMTDEELNEARAQSLAEEVRAHDYDGIFFDWGSGLYDIDERKYTFITDSFQKRHPGMDYDAAAGNFLKRVKDTGLIVILNRGFKSKDAALVKYADIDVVESMFTGAQCGDKQPEINIKNEGKKKVCETWFNTPQKSMKIAGEMLGQARRVNPNAGFVFLNYAFPFYRQTGDTSRPDNAMYEKLPDRQAIFYSLAVSYIAGASGFTCGDDVNINHVVDDVYFFNIGAPMGEFQNIDNHTYVRYFRNGIAVISGKKNSVELQLAQDVKSLYDVYNKTSLSVSGAKVKVHLESQKYLEAIELPTGRLYKYGY